MCHACVIEDQLEFFFYFIKTRRERGGRRERRGKEKTYNMTMHQPSPGIISRERNHQPTTRRQKRDIPPRRIGKRERRNGAIVKSAGARAEDIEIVTVEMDRVGDVRCAAGLLNDPIGPDVGCWELDQVFCDRVARVAFFHVG